MSHIAVDATTLLIAALSSVDDVKASEKRFDSLDGLQTLAIHSLADLKYNSLNRQDDMADESSIDRA